MGEAWFSFISISLTTMIFNLLIMLFFNNLYHGKYKSKLLYFSVWFIVSAIIIGVNSMKIPVLNFAFSFIFYNIICNILYKTNFKQSFFYNFIVILFFTISDIISVLVLTLIKHESYDAILNSYTLMFISDILYVLFLFLTYRICLAIFIKNELRSIRIKEAITITLITVFEIFVIYNLSSLPIAGVPFITIMLGFLFLNIYISYVIYQVSQNIKLKYDLQLSKRQSEMQLEHYTELSDKYNEARKVIHDIRKHIDILSELNNQNDLSATEYGQKMEDEIDSIFAVFQCSNKILSIVVSQKIIAAEKMNIKVITDVEDVELDFISDLDVTAIFSNIWDNAIEACKNIISDEKYIEFIVKQVNGFILINVSNSFSGELKIENDKIISTKQNHEGLGLSIIKSTVEKYNGLLVTEKENIIFNVEITLPIKQ